MTQQQTKYLKIVLWILASLIVIIGALSVWLYNGTLTSAKTKAFSALPFPMAFVNGHPLLMNDFVLRYNVTKNMFGAQVVDQKEHDVKLQIYQQMVNEAELEQVASKHNVSVSGKQMDEEYAYRAAHADLAGKKNFEDLIASYGLNPSQFKDQVIKPDLLLANLQTWLNSQQNLNADAYKTANDYVQRIKSGENMVIMAVALSQDENDRAVGGDLGFMDPSNLVSEIREPVSNMKLGEVKIIPSRYGLHVMRLEEKNGNNLHLREIFIKTQDFNQWYKSETKNFNVKQLIKI